MMGSRDPHLCPYAILYFPYYVCYFYDDCGIKLLHCITMLGGVRYIMGLQQLHALLWPTGCLGIRPSIISGPRVLDHVGGTWVQLLIPASFLGLGWADFVGDVRSSTTRCGIICGEGMACHYYVQFA